MKAGSFFLNVMMLFFLSAAMGQTGDQKRFACTFSPTILTPGNRMALQPGFQFYINNRFSLLTEAAIPLGKSDDVRLKGFRISLELKKNLNPVKGDHAYISFQLAYTQRKIWEDSADYETMGDPVYYASTDIKSPVFVAAVKLGDEIWLKDGFFLDPFVGLGVRHIRTKYYNTIATFSQYTESNYDWRIFEPAWIYNFPQTHLHVTMGIRFGYRFN